MGPKKIITRANDICPVFGALTSDLCPSSLPTYGDVMRLYLSLRMKMKSENGKEPLQQEISNLTAIQVIEIWQRASLPIINSKSVVRKISQYYTKYVALLKSFKKRQFEQNYASKLEAYRHTGNVNLFDIASCQCLDFSLCYCEAVRKIPLEERVFLTDQRTTRQMCIAGVDTKMRPSCLHRQAVFTGKIGKQLANCEGMPVVDFEAIATDLPPNLEDVELSTDQQYLKDMCYAVSDGYCTECLSRRSPGAMSHSRWLTCANRILRLYVATSKPSLPLKELAMFVMKVYAPTWFSIKVRPSSQYGAIHVFNMIRASRYLSDKLKKIIDPVIQRNAYFAHQENLILAMLADERYNIREMAFQSIQRARMLQLEKTPMDIRLFRIPEIDFEAQDYSSMIHWDAVQDLEPAMTKHIRECELLELIGRDEVVSRLQLQEFPCHTQAVERGVRMVTEAAGSVCGQQNRDGSIRSKLESRDLMPKFNTKTEYNFNT